MQRLRIAVLALILAAMLACRLGSAEEWQEGCDEKMVALNGPVVEISEIVREQIRRSVYERFVGIQPELWFWAGTSSTIDDVHRLLRLAATVAVTGSLGSFQHGMRGNLAIFTVDIRKVVLRAGMVREVGVQWIDALSVRYTSVVRLALRKAGRKWIVSGAAPVDGIESPLYLGPDAELL